MDAASAELAESGRLQTEIHRFINECNEKLAAVAALHHRHSLRTYVRTLAGCGRGSGRWKKSDQSAKDALEGNLKDARAGALPSERRAAARASAAPVQESARHNAAHHAASEPPSSALRPEAAPSEALRARIRRAARPGGLRARPPRARTFASCRYR